MRRTGFGRQADSYASEYPDMLLAHLSGRLNALSTKWEAEREKLKSPEDIQRRNRFVREKFREMVHGFPDRTPLNPVVVKVLERDGYRIENVMFQSRPDFWVTGNLYLPTTGSAPFPGVISPCGHYALARMEPEYQSAYINMVKSGFAVLAYDPIGQGERRQYWNPKTDETEVGGATMEHSMAGQLLLLMGEDLSHYRIFDGMRAIDYLLTRTEVDPKRIACAGHSGGGTLTMFISALDERVQCAIVNEGGTGHRWPLHIRPESTVGPSDVEQNLFPAATHGIDLCDLHVAIAPRHLLAMIENYSPRFNRAAEHVRARYVQLGVAERFNTVEATDPTPGASNCAWPQPIGCPVGHTASPDRRASPTSNWKSRKRCTARQTAPFVTRSAERRSTRSSRKSRPRFLLNVRFCGRRPTATAFGPRSGTSFACNLRALRSP